MTAVSTTASPGYHLRRPRVVGFLALAAVCLFFAGATGCKRPASVNVPLQNRPTSQLKMGAFAGEIPETKVHVAAVTDSRPDKAAVGENAEEKKPVPVLTNDDPATFVHDRLVDLLTKAGLQVVPAAGEADRVLKTDLHTFWTRETDTYESEIRVTITAQDRTGKQVWKGTVNGTAERFGRSLKAENYQEVFSDGMIDLVQQLLSNAGFRQALGQKAGGGG